MLPWLAGMLLVAAGCGSDTTSPDDPGLPPPVHVTTVDTPDGAIVCVVSYAGHVDCVERP